MCGIFGIEGHADAANFTYLGLYALQHRGQESSGIVSWDGEALRVERGMGQIADVFDEETLGRLPGKRALGHTRYSTAGTSVLDNAQPIVANTSMGPVALVHNGNLVNALSERKRLEQGGSIFQTSSDTEVILHLMARNPRRKLVDSLLIALERVRGAYSLILLTPDGVIAARDPHGFRPLILGQLENGAACFASESCAFDLLGAKPVRELAPGEVVVVRDGNLASHFLTAASEPARCLFELVYFARPDSTVFGDSVSQARLAMGARLARESPADADIVVPVPDSGLFSAMGYSRESGLPLEFGLIRNHYVGRTFIEPRQSIRDFGVKVKLNPVRQLIEGKRVVLVDDSIVRGTTSPKIVKMVREGGAKEVHLRISCPPTAWPCYYGINMPTREELIASSKSVDEICEFIGADSLGYLSLPALKDSLTSGDSGYCTACWTGEYSEPIGDDCRQEAEPLAKSKELESP